MPRANHKDGCQCAVCKRMAAKVEPKPVAPEDKRVAVGTLIVGSKFKYQPNRSMALNAPLFTYIVHRTVKGMVTAGMVAIDGAGAGNVIELSENTLVLKV